jgi:[ribosomal protein S5]-alanine N-acetyltransferase
VPNPELTSQRLKLRLIQISDLQSIHNLHSIPETDEYNTLGIPKDIDETNCIIETWILDHEEREIQNYTFAVELNENSKFIGLIALKLGKKKYRNAEVWYKLRSDNWGNGFGTEALSVLISYGFDQLNLHRIEAGCAVDNAGSIKVLEKVGMTREGRKRKVLPLKNGWSDNFIYAILESDDRNV